MRKIRCLNERGATLICWVIPILIVLKLLLLAGTGLVQSSSTSFVERDFTDRKVELEDLEQQTKLLGYLLMEKSVTNALNYMDSLPEKETHSREQLETLYMGRINYYLSRNISTGESGEGRSKRRDLAYIEGFVESFESEYGYRHKSKELSVEASVEKESSGFFEKRYRVSYTLKDEKEEIGYFNTAVYMTLRYPSYLEALDRRVEMDCVKILKESL